MAGYAGLQCLTETKDVLNRAKGGRCLLMVNAFFHSGENGKGLHGNHMKSCLIKMHAEVYGTFYMEALFIDIRSWFSLRAFSRYKNVPVGLLHCTRCNYSDRLKDRILYS